MNKKATCRLLAAVALFVTSSNGASAAVHYVDLSNPSPTPPCTNWASAAMTGDVARQTCFTKAKGQL